MLSKIKAIKAKKKEHKEKTSSISKFNELLFNLENNKPTKSGSVYEQKRKSSYGSECSTKSCKESRQKGEIIFEGSSDNRSDSNDKTPSMRLLMSHSRSVSSPCVLPEYLDHLDEISHQQKQLGGSSSPRQGSSGSSLTSINDKNAETKSLPTRNESNSSKVVRHSRCVHLEGHNAYCSLFSSSFWRNDAACDHCSCASLREGDNVSGKYSIEQSEEAMSSAERRVEKMIEKLNSQLEARLESRLQGIEAKLKSIQELFQQKEINGLLIDCESNDLLPNLPGSKGVKWFEGKKDDEKKKKAVADFCQEILKLPESIIKSTTVYDFFTSDHAAVTNGTEVSNSDHTDSGARPKGELPARLNSKSEAVPENSRLPRVGRGHAYEEINLVDGYPAGNRVSLPPDGAERSSDDKQTTIYATVLHKSQLPQDFRDPRPVSVEYAEVKSINMRPSASTSEVDDLTSPTMSETYANASEISPMARIVSSRESVGYQEVMRPEPTDASRISYTEKYEQNCDLKPTYIDFKDSPSKVCIEVSKASETPGIAPEDPPVLAERRKISSSSATTDLVNGKSSPSISGNNTSRRRRIKPSDGSPGSDVILPMPDWPAATLPPNTATLQIPEALEEVPGDSEEIHVVAVADFVSSNSSVPSFEAGTKGILMAHSESHWWYVKIDGKCGWVPADYWRMIDSGECNTVGRSPWFSGKLSRSSCEDLLMKHGEERNFSVRESTNRVGIYALSVKHNNRIHHFPIELTPDKKYNIGQHDFKSMTNIITYYKKNPLFYDDYGCGVMLGKPLVIAEVVSKG